MPHRRKDSPYWWISYTDASGQRIRQSSGTADRKEAAAIEAKRRYESHQQQQWGTEPQRAFDELILAYLRETQSKKTHDRDKYSAKRLYQHLSGIAINTLSPQDINNYKRARLAEGVKDGTIIKELRLLSAAINHAKHEWGWDIPNIVTGRVPKKPQGKLRWLTRDEYHRLLDSAKKTKADYLPEFITIAVNTGMRRGEILGLEWSRVDFGKRLVCLQPEHAKTGTFQTVPLNTVAVDALKRLWGQHSQWVFSYRGKRLASVKKSFSAAVAGAGLDGVTVHTLRHTCAAWLVQAGVPIRTVADILRHTDVRTTMVYAHLSPENVHDGVALLERDQIVTTTGENVTKKANFSKNVTAKSL